MTIRILLSTITILLLGAGPPPSSLSTQAHPESFWSPPPSDAAQKHPDLAMEAAMAARAERARLKSLKSLSDTLLTPEEKPKTTKSAWKQRKPPAPKQPRQVYIARRENISPALRASFSGTRRFCYGKCGR